MARQNAHAAQRGCDGAITRVLGDLNYMTAALTDRIPMEGEFLRLAY
jgi:hypothetical protein